MDQIQPSQIAQFMRRFHFKGGVLRRFSIRNRTTSDASGEIALALREGDANQRARLRLVLDGVAEFRFQRRPGPGLVRLKEVRLGYFNGLFYLNFDAFPDDGPPAIIDFRASDAFVAARSISWELLPPKTKPSS